MTILVIDDNIRNLRLLTDMLAAIGHEVQAIDNANEGLATARSQSFDLIFMDVQMPKMSGTEVMHILKDDNAWQPAPIIAITAYAMQGDEHHLLAEGFDAYVSKPVSVSQLLETIQSFQLDDAP